MLLLGGSILLPEILKEHSRLNFTSQCDDEKKPKLVLDDCLNPACHSTMDLLKKFNIRKKASPKVAKTTEENNPYCTGCPVDRDQLGRGTWDLIHTIAATYPEKPTTEQQQNTDMFLRSLSTVYPCPYCATHFQQCIAASPPE